MLHKSINLCRFFVILLPLSLVSFQESEAQRGGSAGVGTNAANWCNFFTSGSGITPTEELHVVCIEGSGKTYASTEYTKYPASWTTLQHEACIQSTNTTTQTSYPNLCQFKNMTSVPACPVRWIEDAGYVQAEGKHRWQGAPNSSMSSWQTQYVFGYQSGSGT